MSWVIYGATGTTGALIAEAAVRRGHRPVLAGRSAERLAPLADRLSLQWQAVDLEDGAGLARLAGAAYRTTGIGDITVETTMAGPPGLVRAVMPVAAAVAGSGLVSRRLAARSAGRREVDTAGRTFVQARVEDAEGGAVESWLETGEGYLFTAEAAVRAVEAVQAGSSAAGAHTPGALLGPDFPLDIPGTRRHDTVVRIA